MLYTICPNQVFSITRDPQCLVPMQFWYLFYRPRRNKRLSYPYPILRLESNWEPIAWQAGMMTTTLSDFLTIGKAWLSLRHIGNIARIHIFKEPQNAFSPTLLRYEYKLMQKLSLDGPAKKFNISYKLNYLSVFFTNDNKMQYKLRNSE